MKKILISSIDAWEILDSRGFPTVAASVTTETGVRGEAYVPSGASTGEHEAVELRDGESARYSGLGVRGAIASIQEIKAQFIGKNVLDQEALDHSLVTIEGTPNKSRLGANALLALSLSFARAAAASLDFPLYFYLGGYEAHRLPCPMMNIINGGMHADNSLDFQEFMIRPVGAPTFAEALRYGCEVYHTLRSLLKESGHVVAVGDEGGFAPRLASHEEALQWIVLAIQRAGFTPGKEISIALDCAASSFFDPATNTYLELKKRGTGQAYAQRTREEQVEMLLSLVNAYPIDSIEDGMAENDWEGWKLLTEKLGSKIQIVGDDLFVTQTSFLKRGIREQIANAILIKPNQVGTLTETIACVELAQQQGYRTILSHRSGETEDSTIADLAVGLRAGQIKTGAPCRAERTAKYNRLLYIEHQLKDKAIY